MTLKRQASLTPWPPGSLQNLKTNSGLTLQMFLDLEIVAKGGWGSGEERRLSKLKSQMDGKDSF